MKNYLAVFLGKPEAMDAWRAMPEQNVIRSSRPV